MTAKQQGPETFALALELSVLCWCLLCIANKMLPQGSQIRKIWRLLHQNCSDDSTEVMEGVTSTREIFGNKQGAISTPKFLVTNIVLSLPFLQQIQFTLIIICKRCKP